MIPRRALQPVERALVRQAAVALIGPRQVGKTTLAFDIASTRHRYTLTSKRAKIGKSSVRRRCS
jgi:predicted AAA+ superfamily ATPase